MEYRIKITQEGISVSEIKTFFADSEQELTDYLKGYFDSQYQGAKVNYEILK